MSERSRALYRALVYEEPDFPRFFEQVTPIAELAALNIGSRPSKRARGRDRGAARDPVGVRVDAEPACCCRPGTARARALAEGPLELQREMAAGWPFFQSLLSTLEMALYKTDLGVAERYLRLVEPELRDRFWPRHRARVRRRSSAGCSRSRARPRCSTTRPRCSAGCRTATRGSTRSRTCRSSCSPAPAPAATTRASRCWRRSPGSPRACATRAERHAVDGLRSDRRLRTRAVSAARVAVRGAWTVAAPIAAELLLITGALLSLYVGLRGGAWAVGALERAVMPQRRLAARPRR